MKYSTLFTFVLFCSAPALAQTGVGLSGASTLRKPAAEWPTLRANNNRDGRVVAKGQFTDIARVEESIDFSTSEAYIELFPGSKNSEVILKKDIVEGPEGRSDIASNWQLNSIGDLSKTGAYIDLYGDGKFTLVSQSQNSKYFQLFEGDKKYYRIEAYDGFGSTVNVNDDTFIGIRVFEANTSTQILEMRFPKGDYMQRPHITVADMNNDGKRDIVITSWEGIYVYNTKGERIASLSQTVPGWHHLRKRGYACLKDIDGNGYKDVIIISSLPWHVDVIKNDNGVLRFGWTKIFDGLVETAKKISRPILNSVNDFDGDGKFEILVNVYNFNDDNNWAGVIFDAITGDVKGQIRNAYVVSAEDLNSNGKFMFFCTETKGQSVPVAAALRVVMFDGMKTKDVLSVPRGEWINPRIANTSPLITSHNDGVSSLAEDVVLCIDYENSGHRSFFIKTSGTDGSSAISAYNFSDANVPVKSGFTVGIPQGMYGEILRYRSGETKKHSFLLQVTASGRPAGRIKVTGATSKALGRFNMSSSKITIPVVADINADGLTEILVANDVGELLCFSRDTKGKMSLLWRVPGHGMSWQYSPAMEYGVAVDDLDHDGQREVIVSGSDEAGAVLYVYDSKGKMRWKASFPEIHGGEMTAFDGNIAFYGTVQSSGRKNRDVVVTVQRGIAHGGKTYCLNGMDGSVIWSLDRLEAERGERDNKPIDSGAGGYVLSSYDINNDGADEVMCGYGNIVFFANSNDGAVEFKAFMRKVFIDHYNYPEHGYESFWMQQITPVAFKSGGELELACFNTMVAAGTMDTKGKLIWSPETLDYRERYWQCMADLEGNGKLWVAEVAIRITDNVPVLFAYDPATGDMHPSFNKPLPGFTPGLGAGIMPVATDVNGDGKDEILISNTAGVSCFALVDNKVVEVWKYLAHGCGPVVVADTDSDGYVEVITASQEGKVIILDK
ncbi:MAG TPA: VCBS repeat-containing protein [Chryseolinea sp.]|nr:VCBS repeat-containing protein [Chryseolinea sp.]